MSGLKATSTKDSVLGMAWEEGMVVQKSPFFKISQLLISNIKGKRNIHVSLKSPKFLLNLIKNEVPVKLQIRSYKFEVHAWSMEVVRCL